MPSATEDTTVPEKSRNHAVADLEYGQSETSTQAKATTIYPTVLSIGQLERELYARATCLFVTKKRPLQATTRTTKTLNVQSKSTSSTTSTKTSMARRSPS